MSPPEASNMTEESLQEVESQNQSSSVEIDSHSRPDVLELHTEYLGDIMKDKQKGHIRIGFLNINGLPKFKGAAKYDYH